jgi:Flp pilus assembly protein, ATPase CpaF
MVNANEGLVLEKIDYNEGRIPFYFDVYVDKIKGKKAEPASAYITFDNSAQFQGICEAVKDFFNREWDAELSSPGENKEEILAERHKNAILGYPSQVSYFKSKIQEFLKDNKLLDTPCPRWYDNLVDGIFHEIWGLAGMAKWMSLNDSSSAKIIGDRIYYYIKGKPVLQEQRISYERFEKLRRALMLKTPKRRLDEQYSEVYMHSGERISIFYGDLVFEGQPCMTFRKYIVTKLTFEEQAQRGTLPKEMIPFLRAAVSIGYNTSFVGPVRSGKSTMLATYQNYEDKGLEGVAIQTDPEIPFHKYYPDAPIMQLIADGEDLNEIGKKVVRSDADYIIMAEARDGYAFNCLVEMADKGTIRNKSTMHIRKVENFCYNIANKIQQAYGGSLDYNISKVADSYHYVYEMISLRSDRSKKRLKGIYEIRFNSNTNGIEFHQICNYNAESDSWTFKYDIGKDKLKLGQEENPEALKVFCTELKRLSELFPMDENNVVIPFYSQIGGK